MIIVQMNGTIVRGIEKSYKTLWRGARGFYVLIVLVCIMGCVQMSNVIIIEEIDRLSDYTGKTITVTGRISDTPWQHIIGYEPDHPFSYYFDVGDMQTVIYSESEIQCRSRLRVTGKVIEVGTKSKKPGSDTDYKEYQILVENKVCIE
jgi:hypothetical protein